MKIKINFPKIEIIHTRVNKPYKQSGISSFFESLVDFLEDANGIFWGLVFALITIGLFIGCYKTDPPKKLYDCTIISIVEREKKSPKGYFEYQGYRFEKNISQGDYMYIKQHNLKTLKINTSDDVIKDYVTLSDILGVFSIIMAMITIIRLIIGFADL